MSALLQDDIVVIGWWTDESSNKIVLQDFVRDGHSFIPIFSDEDRFRAETAGSGFESKGLAIKRRLLHSILRGDEVLVLNPGSDAVRLCRADLAHPS